jgi:membrane protein
MARSEHQSGVLGTVLAACLVVATVGHRVRHGGRHEDGGRPERVAAAERPPAPDEPTQTATGSWPAPTDAPPDAPSAAPAIPAGGGGVLDRVIDPVDRLQRRFTVTAFPVGVLKKFSEDRAGQLAALVAYYSFFSLFPLLLVLVTVLRFVLAGNEDLQREILDSALAQFPVIGDELDENVDAIDGSTLALVAGSIGALWAGLRAMTAAQRALDEVWDVPMFERPNFLFSRLRGLALMALIGAGVLGSIVVSNVAAIVDVPGLGRLALFAGSIALNVAVVGCAYLVLTDLPLKVRHIWPGAIIGGVSYWLLQLAGSAIVRRVIDGAQGADGTFAVVIGLLTWLFLIAQVTLMSAEINVVWCRRLWPRSLTGRNITEADVRAFTSYARQAKRSDVVHVHVTEAARPGADLVEPADGAGVEERRRVEPTE